jgi:hypothetical protein
MALSSISLMDKIPLPDRCQKLMAIDSCIACAALQPGRASSRPAETLAPVAEPG